jgi:flagellar export protein FliJ
MKSLANINRLLDLRDQEVERLQAEFAAKEALRRRYHNALERLDNLFVGSGASGTLPPAMALNCGEYKQSVLQLSATHRQTMAQHEADTARTCHALRVASQRQKALSQVAERQLTALRVASERKEQKRQDDAATQVWLRKDGL